MPRNERLIIVANRLPVQRVGTGAGARWEESGGGLVTALAPIVREKNGSWIGWTGTAGNSPRPFVHEGISIRPVSLSERDVLGFYNHISNRTFWPLYHDAIRTPDFNQEWWRPYFEVNRRYARAAAAAAQPGDHVWVHDYHLQLVPQMLREMRPGLKIGFFLHIPFPPEELFAWLPWRTQIVRGLLGADVVGFQTHAAVQNFVRAAREYTGVEGAGSELEFEGRRVRVGSFPISIDSQWFEERSRTPEAAYKAASIRANVGSKRKILLCVDRLDYTKGIDSRLQAFELMLQRKRVSVDDCVMIQIAVPSRETAFEYAEMRTRIEQIVGRINGEYSEPGRVAVHYFRRSLKREDLVAYYRAADVMVVTPLRDGMNLVAKEYVATRADGSGVLVLSEFAGASRELRRALLVNPRDIEGMASAMEAALTMPRREARQRMSILRMIVRRHDVHEWAESFLEALKE